MWVRSIIVSGRREMGKTQPIYWRIETSVVWCEFCGKPFRWPKDFTPEPQEFRVSGAADYYALINPERTSYRGVDVRWYDRWLPQSDPLVVPDHANWEKEAFLQGGWVHQ